MFNAPPPPDKRRPRPEKTNRCRRRPSGLTLIEVLIVMSVLSVVLVPVLGIFGYLTHAWGAQVGRAKAIQAATLGMDAITKEVGKAVSFSAAGSGGRTNIFTLPADTDARGNYAPIYSGGSLVYQNGTQVRYYLSDATGATSASGSILWRETKPGGAWIADTTWSRSPGSTTRGRVANVTALTFTTAGLPTNTVRVTLTVSVVESKQTNTYTVGRDVYLSNHN